jgi:hypothetical protein
VQGTPRHGAAPGAQHAWAMLRNRIRNGAPDLSASKKASSSFLKKRTKKLSVPAHRPLNETATAHKSLLLLFFRKEVLPSLKPKYPPTTY